MAQWQRANGGQFAPGNRGGPGSPMAGQVQRLRSALLQSVSEDDIRDLGQGLLRLALKGDLEAAKLVLKYTVGEPNKMPPAEECEIDELKRRAEVRKLKKLEDFDNQLYGPDE